MYSVVLIDDEPFIVDGIEVLINWHKIGLNVIKKFYNSTDALNYIMDNHVDIMITDIKMPTLNGLELIEKSRKILKDCHYIILSGYNDFEFVKKGIQLGIDNYLTKPVNIEELTSTLLEIVENLDIQNEIHSDFINNQQEWNIIRTHILSRWINNSISFDELLNRSKILNLITDSTEYSVAIVNIETKENLSITTRQIYHLCQHHLISHPNLMSFEDIEGNLVIIFAGDTSLEKESEYKKNILNQLYINMNNLSLCTKISLGPPVSSYKTVSLSYKQAKDMLDYFLIFPDCTVLDCSVLSTNYLPISARSFGFDHKILHQHMISYDLKSVHELLDKTTLDILSIDSLTKQSVRLTITDIYMHLFQELGNRFQDIGQLILHQHSQLLNSIDSFSTLNDFKDKLFDSLTIIAESLHKKDSTTNPIIQQVTNYIHQNYQEELSLKTLSYNFHVNATYLGQLFKKELQTSFPNYLNQYRINIAKDMLLNTTYKTADIAKSIGYPDPNYFYRIFKKYVGLSPTDYKRVGNT